MSDLKSVKTSEEALRSEGSCRDHALWIGDSVLEVSMRRDGRGFPPEQEHSGKLNNTIQGLARAVKAVVYAAENDDSGDTSFLMQPVVDLADAIILLTQLSGAAQAELGAAK